MNTARTGRWLVGYYLAVMSSQGLAQSTITFDGTPFQPPGTQYGVHSYSEGGMVFSSISAGGMFARNGGSISFYPENGTVYLQALAGDSLSFHYGSGALFDLNSVDISEYSVVAQQLYGTIPVHFVGYHADGSTIETDIIPDGIIDGVGPLPDFQTFAFAGWTNLTRVEIPTYGWSMDNLVVTPLPEPGTLALGAVGLAALLYAARRGRR